MTNNGERLEIETNIKFEADQRNRGSQKQCSTVNEVHHEEDCVEYEGDRR